MLLAYRTKDNVAEVLNQFVSGPRATGEASDDLAEA